MSLELRNITFGYKNEDKKILDDFSVSFPADKITALTGRNGAGKTTLARIVMGMIKPQHGDIMLDGERINDFTLTERGRLIGYVMQNPTKQIFSATVDEEVRYGLQNIGASEEETELRIKEYLSYFGLEHHRQSFPFALSHGEKQRLVLAAILAMKPKYLILDEPTASLDFKRKRILGQLLSEISCGEISCGIIVISHDNGFIDTYCRNIVRLEAGDE